MKSMNKWFEEDRSRIIAIFFAVFASVCFFCGMFGQMKLYPIDYGQYETLLPQYGLTYTAADLKVGDLQYARPITEFVYTHFSWMKLFTPASSGGTVYAIAVVRALTEPFGMNFQVDLLAIVWMILIIWCTQCLMRNLYMRFGPNIIPAGLILCGVYTDGNFCAMFRSLYPQGAEIAFTLLFMAMIARAFGSAKGRGFSAVFPVALSGVLFLKASSAMIVFIPAVILVTAELLHREYGSLVRKQLTIVLCLVLVLIGASASVKAFQEDGNMFSNAASYLSVFGAILPNSQQQTADLAKFGLDESYLDDIGKSFYEDESVYVHNPREEGEATKLFAKVNPTSIMNYYATNPGLLFTVMSNQSQVFNSYQNLRNQSFETVDGTAAGMKTNRVDGGITGLVRLIWSGHYQPFFLLMMVMSLLALGYGIHRKNYVVLSSVFMFLGMACYLPVQVMFGGTSVLQHSALYQVFLQDVTFLVILSVVILATVAFSVWATQNNEDPKEKWNAILLPVKECKVLEHLKSWTKTICDSRKWTVIIVALVAFGMILFTEFKAGHAACVNNGDFGRMMQQIGVTWNSSNYYDTDSQYNHQAIEDYVWLYDFDWKRLTPLTPSYSLYLFAAIFRMFGGAIGQSFSTYALAILMALLTGGAVVLMTHDLFPVLKRWTLLAGLGLCTIFCSESYLVWYNSLYGESCALIGILLSACVAVHLAVMERKGFVKRALWFILLILSLVITVNSKSQMLLAVPGAVLLLGVLLWHHKPYRLDYRALLAFVALFIVAFIGIGSWGVYQSDRSESSVSSKHTLWQSYFYGIFMISDDPIGDMEALGVDTAMAADIGKYVDFSHDENYVYAPLSDEAQTAFYDHVSMVTALEWYLTHPTKLWQMLDHAASEAQEQYDDFRVYVGQDYSEEHDQVDGFALWQYWRRSFSPSYFAGYLILYLFLIIVAVIKMGMKRTLPSERALWGTMLSIMLIGVLQFPLTVLGNGFADNQKQLFSFILCHDLILLFTILVAARILWKDEALTQAKKLIKVVRSSRKCKEATAAGSEEKALEADVEAPVDEVEGETPASEMETTVDEIEIEAPADEAEEEALAGKLEKGESIDEN